MTSYQPIYFSTLNKLTLFRNVKLQIYDPKTKRYEVPIPTPKVSKRAPSTDYKVQFSKSPMGLVVTRAADGTVM